MSSTRQIGYGTVGGIHWREIRAYLDFYPQIDELRFTEIIRRLDHEYLGTRRRIAQRKAEESKAQQRGKR